MKGKLWELGPFVLAILVGLYVLIARLREAPPAPIPASEAARRPRAGMPPHESSGAGDPTKPQDFLPDAHSEPDPHGLPDPSASTATRGAPVKR